MLAEFDADKLFDLTSHQEIERHAQSLAQTEQHRGGRIHLVRLVLADGLCGDPWRGAVGKPLHRQTRLLAGQSQPLSKHGLLP